MSNVYSSSKIFHFPEQLRKIAAGDIPPPLHVRLKPTNRCNHSCSYCCYRNPDLLLNELMRENDEIPRDKMRAIVADLIAMEVRAVTFSGGGEPLCSPYIVEAVTALAKGGVKIAMLTNGALLDGDIAELLAGEAVWVRVSMDAADADSYARTRSVSPKEFNRVCDNIRSFTSIADRKCVLGVNLIVTRENSSQVRGFLEMARELGVDHVKVSGAVVSTNPEENRDYIAQFHDTAKKQILEAQATMTDDHFAIIDKLHYPESGGESFVRDYKWCPMAHCLTVIAADLNVYTCQDKAYTTNGLLGSLKEQSFAELWASSDLRDRLKGLDPSRDCRHHCVAHGKNLSLIDYFEADGEHLDFV